MLTAKQITAKFQDSKTLPHVAIKVTQLVNDENSTMQDFEGTIQLDPILVSRLLRLVNSPFMGLPSKVESISKAVVFVGMKNLRNLVAVEAMRDMFKGADDGSGFSPRNLWLHSASVAIITEIVGKRIFGDGREELFLAGIIHDVGLIAENQVAGEQLRQACTLYQPGKNSLIECERQIIGTDHCEVGYLLAKEWKLPSGVLKAIRYHHKVDEAIKPASVVGILQLAEYIAGKMKYPMILDKIEPLPAHLVRHVKSMMANYKIIVRDLPAEMAKAKSLYESEG
ncbi:MAG: HDOD domain-containing protein [Deltaproteobacteria bacterium]|nr:HDOD domain-containing protein [Deltaproteobacteria bacterium]